MSLSSKNYEDPDQGLHYLNIVAGDEKHPSVVRIIGWIRAKSSGLRELNRVTFMTQTDAYMLLFCLSPLNVCLM